MLSMHLRVSAKVDFDFAKGSDLDIFQTVLRSLQSRSKIRRNGILSVKFFNDSRDFIEVFTHRVEARGLGIEIGKNSASVEHHVIEVAVRVRRGFVEVTIVIIVMEVIRVEIDLNVPLVSVAFNAAGTILAPSDSIVARGVLKTRRRLNSCRHRRSQGRYRE